MANYFMQKTRHCFILVLEGISLPKRKPYVKSLLFMVGIIINFLQVYLAMFDPLQKRTLCVGHVEPKAVKFEGGPIILLHTTAFFMYLDVLSSLQGLPVQGLYTG